MSGAVVSINVNSEGGVPKLPVRSAILQKEGVQGDKQNDLRHHGGPDRAVSIYSIEMIELLVEEGHPISQGSTGENITIGGLDWRLVKSGVVLKMGDACVEITSPAAPCATIKKSFMNDNFSRISEKVNPGFSRWYGRVLTEAKVEVGDEVIVLK